MENICSRGCNRKDLSKHGYYFRQRSCGKFMSLCPMRLSKQVTFTCCFSCPCVIIFGAPSHRNFAQAPDRQETMVWLIYWVQLIVATLVYRSVAATHLLIIQKYTELCRLQNLHAVTDLLVPFWAVKLFTMTICAPFACYRDILWQVQSAFKAWPQSCC